MGFGGPDLLYQENLKPISAQQIPIELEVVMIHENEMFRFYHEDAKELSDLGVGWNLSVDQGSCSSGTITVSKAETGKSDRFHVKRMRDEGLFSRLVGNCVFSDSSSVYHIRMLGERYFAFLTNEPGWILFDKTKGQFLPFVIRTKVNAMPEIGFDANKNIYVTHVAQKGNPYDLAGASSGGVLGDGALGVSVKSLRIDNALKNYTFVLPGYKAN